MAENRKHVPITILQTADNDRYARLLFVSSQSAQTYCSRKGLTYEMTLGVRYGAKPWHAALNRISILKDYVDRGYQGWILYIDADAYVADLDFDIHEYLGQRRNFALIAAPSGVLPPRWWDVNNGVFAINLGHPLGIDMVERWYAKLIAIPEDVLSAEERWGDVADDQEMVHAVLQEIDGMESALYRDEPPHVLNWQGRFIRQMVRESGSLEQRVQRLAMSVAASLGADIGDVSVTGPDAPARSRANEEFVEALYRVFLGREPDPPGMKAALQSLGDGSRNYVDELRECLGCDEFAERAAVFLEDFLRADVLHALGSRWSRPSDEYDQSR